MKMKINRCKLDKNTQRKLVEFFVAEVTARTS
ncbi:IS1595 family transposase, partial [Acinetobacter baumannii]